MGELAFKLPTEGLPERRVDLVRHHLDHPDIVPLQIAAALPKTLPGCPDEAGRAPELVCQFVQEFFEARVCYRLTVARSRGQKNSHELRCCTHDALRSRACPSQLSRRISVVTVSTCSPNRFI